jgi:glycosyltransferase involved in cell wall biosynthesis
VRILILNWRDAKHPKAGGAEHLTHEIARRLVERGDEVEWFSAMFQGAPREEIVDGIRIVRAGRQWTVHLRAFSRYRGRLRGRFDAVLDEVNTIPFFTPLWAGIPSFMLIYQLAREVWWYESRFPLSAIGYAIEPLYLRVYRRSPVLTISASTESDLRELGFTGSITVVPIGIDPPSQDGRSKSSEPVFLYVGRLAPSKRVGDILRAFAGFQREAGPARLWLVGSGKASYVRRLTATAAALGVGEAVEFLGRLPDECKYRRMAQAHALVLTSVREGWGLVVTEAAARSTPAIVYDVAGLRDSVRHERTGLVVDASPQALAQAMLRLHRDSRLYSRLVRQGRRWSEGFRFDQSTRVLRSTLVASVG